MLAPLPPSPLPTNDIALFFWFALHVIAYAAIGCGIGLILSVLAEVARRGRSGAGELEVFLVVAILCALSLTALDLLTGFSVRTLPPTVHEVK